MSSSTSSSSWARGAAAFVLTLAVLAVGVGAGFWSDLVEAGTRSLKYRDAVRVPPPRDRRELPLAVFLGDSTFMPPFAYPRRIGRDLEERLEVRLFWWEGFEPFHHYLLVGPVMELEPDLVIVVAQPRVFWRHEPLWYSDLLTLVPPSELPRAVLLPFHARSVSVPRVVLASLYGSLGEGGEELLRAFVGARKRAEGVPVLAWLVPYRAPSGDSRRLAQLREIRFEHYGMPIYEGHPAVRALAATVEQAERKGARTLVLVSPIPIDRLREAGLYDDDTYAARIQVIRDAVEGEGGEILDLHAILEPDDFSDEFGHMREAGSRKVALALEPWIRKALSRPSPSR